MSADNNRESGVSCILIICLAYECLTEIMKMYEANYPETMKTTYVVNGEISCVFYFGLNLISQINARIIVNKVLITVSPFHSSEDLSVSVQYRKTISPRGHKNQN